MFKRSQARKDWHAYKQRWPVVEKTQGYVQGFGQRLDEAESLGKATVEAIAKCEASLGILTAALDAEIAALTTLAYAFNVNDGVVKKAQTANPAMTGILSMWTTLVQASDLDDVPKAAKSLKDLRDKVDSAANGIKMVHTLYTRA